MSNLPNFASDVLNSLPAAVLVVDMADKFSFANPAAETLLQTSATQLQ
ncbi:MAG: PAS domain-containing protein, partial [Alphaproteobacteria bacterium]